MDLTPFLLASSIAKMIRSPFCPDIFSNLLPGNLGWLTHAHASIGQRAVSVGVFCVNGDGLAEQSDLLKRHVRMDNSVEKEVFSTHILVLPSGLPHPLVFRLGEGTVSASQCRLRLLEPAQSLDILV